MPSHAFLVIAPRISGAALALACSLGALAHTATNRIPSGQFESWGSAGPKLAAAPAGWTKTAAERTHDPAAETPAEKKARGFALFAVDPFAIDTSAFGRITNGSTAVLQTFASPGEYEPLAIGIRPLEDLSDVRVTLSPLRSAEGAEIPGPNVDVRVVRSVRVISSAAEKRYRWQPFVLEQAQRFPARTGRYEFVWITVKIPALATAATFTGSLSIESADHMAARVPVTIEVLPFVLPPAPCEMVMYYPHPANDDAMLRKELTDIREHGATPIPAMEVRVKSRDKKFGDDDVAETTKHCRRMLAALQSVYGDLKFPLTFEAGHQIIYEWDQKRGWFVHWEHTQAVQDDLVKAINVVANVAGDYGVPGLRIYVNDEAGAHNLLNEAVYWNAFIKHRFPEIATTTTIGGGMALGHDEIGQLTGVIDLFSANRFTPEVARALVSRGKPYAVYNGAGATSRGARFFFGFYGWKTGASQIGQWVYHFGESIFTGNGIRQEDEGYVYHAPDGPLPSLPWEAVREGIDDYRYISLLWSMIATAKSMRAGDGRAAAEQSEKMLTNMLSAIDWNFQAMESSERTSPPDASVLQGWRRQVAQQIVSLSRYVAAGVAKSAARPSPLDLPWASAKTEEVVLGRELLPPSDFEAGMKPWRVEAWKGKGAGGLDTAEFHLGRQSVRITVPPASGDEAVTVLVWPKYGANQIDVSLQAGHSYEFSAWVKWTERSLPPELRMNLPSKAIAKTRSGKDRAAADGWQRFWKRIDVAATGQPSYVGLWVQGPGTVWIDDLSLREISRP